MLTNLNLFGIVVKIIVHGRVRFNGFQYVPVTDRNHPPAPEETISMQFRSNIAENAARSHFPPRHTN